MPDFGSIYWEQEEAGILDIANDKETFYEEMMEVAKEYLESRDKNYDAEELKGVVRYQKARFPDYKPLKEKEFYFTHNIPEYFDTFFLLAL